MPSEWEYSLEAKPRHLLKRIHLCDDVCYDLFGFFGPVMVGLKIAQVCAQFDAVADKVLRRKRWMLGEMQIRKAKEGDRLELATGFFLGHKEATFPLARSPLLDGIIGFKHLRISYVDQNVIAFLRHFQRLFSQRKIRLYCEVDLTHQGWDLVMAELWPMLAKGVVKLALFAYTTAEDLRRHFTPSILLNDCANVCSICCPYIFPEAMPSLADNASNFGQALFKWLHIPLCDGSPKILYCRASCGNAPPSETIITSVEKFKNHFTNGQSSVSYVIAIVNSPDQPSFELVNWQTRERLTLSKLGTTYFLKRCPIEWDAQMGRILDAKALEDCGGYSYVQRDHVVNIFLYQGKKDWKPPDDPVFGI